jgi:glutamate N-acetyltransferase/amino-acid N-acetyltransferase
MPSKLRAAGACRPAAAAPRAARAAAAAAPPPRAALAPRRGLPLRRAGAALRPARRAPLAAAAASAADLPGDFGLPSAPMCDLIPTGPWRAVEGGVCAPAGFRAQGMHAGLRAAGAKGDLALVVCEVDAAAAGVFTLNVMAAAPVTYCREVLARRSTARAVLVNAGQANAATGAAGYADALACADAAAAALGVARDDVLLQSTGVIGRRIKVAPLLAALPPLVAGLAATPAAAARAAIAITTTDLVSKAAALEVELSPGRVVRLGGAAKGSGMIHPNMATMLGVVTCDAPVAPEAWTAMLRRAAAASFNQITVDGDTSTNDTVIGLASGLAGGAPIADAGSPEGAALEGALTALLQGLAKAIAWDGEGATLLLECEVSGAADDAAARAVAKSVVGSSLVKSAAFGHDPNWGRIAAAAGYAGVPYDQDDLAISLGGTPLMERGQPLEFDAAAASTYLKAAAAAHGAVRIDVSVGGGPGRGAAWGCDLSYDYVKINAEYTT